jgi:undecaprenyl-diphosphatase
VADAARYVTLLGGWAVVTALAAFAALFLAFRARAEAGLVLFVGTFMGRLLVDLQKYELGRLRPDQHAHLVSVNNLSFPSGHSANAMMTYGAIAMILVADRRKRMWSSFAALIVVLVVGLSRIMLGVHWPSDVVAGWSFGLLWALILVRVAERAPKARRAKGRVQ